MSLSDLQRAVAELVCDGSSLDAYRRDPAGWLRARSLAGRDGAVLDGLDQASLLAFHEIHARDRAYFLEAVLPLTAARIGAGWDAVYFAERPYGDDDTRAEARRFVGHLERMRDAATVSLARFELARFELLSQPPFRPAFGRLLRDPATPRLAPGLAVVGSSCHLPTLVDDPRAPTDERAGVALLRRDEDDVATAWIEGCEGELLLAVARGEQERIPDLLATRLGEEAYLDMLAQGVFV